MKKNNKEEKEKKKNNRKQISYLIQAKIQNAKFHPTDLDHY